MLSYPKEILPDGEFLAQLEAFFSAEELEDLARATRFIERSTSRLTGQAFLMLNVFQEGNGQEVSLTDLCDHLEEWFGIRMTKQSLDERFNTHAVDFLRQCFHRMMYQKLLGSSLTLQGGWIKKIILTDATSFQIPQELAVFYPGAGGSSSEAVVKIHHSYDVVCGQPIDIQVVAGRSSDSDYASKGALSIQPNALYLRDLGYFDYAYFRSVQQHGGYYLSRCKSNIRIFKHTDEEQYESLEQIFALLTETGQFKDVSEVFVGAKKELKTRLIIERVPEEVAQKRLRQLELKAKKSKKWKVSQQRKQACYFNIYMTNIPQEFLPPSEVRAVYSLRWQIELYFKIWKSLLGIDKVKKMNVFRFECYLYGKLIAILLNAKLQHIFKTHLWEEHDFELSEWKAAKLIKKNSTI